MNRAMLRSGALLAVALLVAGCAARGRTGGIADSATVPLLLAHEPYAPELDDPPALRAELIRRERAAVALLHKAAREPADADHGCVRASPTVNGLPQPRRWLPRPPRIHARLLGRQVQVDVALQGDPTSLPCRPLAFTIVVKAADGETIGGVANYILFAPGFRSVPRRFRVLGQIPIGSGPPYHLTANTESTAGRSDVVERDLPCPTTGDPVRGCLHGTVPRLHAYTVPSPTLPLRGATAHALLRSFRAAFAWDPQLQRYGHARCPTATVCAVDIDAPLRRARGTATYRIQGEQVDGCWLGTLTGVARTPQDAELTMPATIGGCVSWT